MKVELFPLFVQTLDVIHGGWLAPVVALRQVSEGDIRKQSVHHPLLGALVHSNNVGRSLVAGCGDLEPEIVMFITGGGSNFCDRRFWVV